MAKLLRIDEFGTELISDDFFHGCDDWDESIGLTFTGGEEFIIRADVKLNGE